MAEELKTLSQEEIDSKKEAQAILEAQNDVKIVELGEKPVSTEVAITSIKIADPKEVSFVGVDGTEEADSLDAYNKPAETLAKSINENTVGFQKDIQETFNQFGKEVVSANSEIRKDANVGLAKLYDNILALQSAHNAQEKKFAALDEVYQTDIDVSERTAKIIEINKEFAGVNTDFFDNFKAIVERINKTEVTTNRKFVIDTSSGTANFNLRLNDLGEFSSGDDYIAKIESVSARNVDAYISKVDGDGFDIELISKRFILEKAHNAEVEPVTVVISISHMIKEAFVIGDGVGINKEVTK